LVVSLLLRSRPWRDRPRPPTRSSGFIGGLLGRKVELVVEDTRSEPTARVAALNKLLISTKADLIVGGASSAGTRAMSAILVRRIELFGRHVIPAGKA
jgi:branched-chain amino acid transport system substrate-binding protein